MFKLINQAIMQMKYENEDNHKSQRRFDFMRKIM